MHELCEVQTLHQLAIGPLILIATKRSVVFDIKVSLSVRLLRDTLPIGLILLLL